MTQFSGEIDSYIAERIEEIRDRFGTGGLRAAIDMAAAEISIVEGEAASLTDDGGPSAPDQG